MYLDLICIVFPASRVDACIWYWRYLGVIGSSVAWGAFNAGVDWGSFDIGVAWGSFDTGVDWDAFVLETLI